MDKTITPQERLEQLLPQGIEQIKRLLEVLEQEYQSLQDPNPERLEKITQQKQKILVEVDIFVEKQNHLLKQLGYSIDKHGMKKFINETYIGTQHPQQWTIFQDLLVRCHKQNEINSGVISLSKRQTTNTLDLLYGLSAGGKIYGPTGESLSTRNSNSLGKA